MFSAGLLTAATLFLMGHPQAALKVVLFILLVPGVVLFSAAGIGIVREPGWHRRPRALAAAAFLLGCVLALLPILAYAPWAPDRFPLSSMPLGLPVIAIVGVALTLLGAALGLLVGLHGAWRARDWGRLVWLAVVAAFLGWILAAAIEANV